jgi:hypothetical protein
MVCFFVGPPHAVFGWQSKASACRRMVARVFGCRTGCDMDWADYLRDQAAKYRQLAETTEDLSIKQELLDLAAICDEAANNIEDRMPGG